MLNLMSFHQIITLLRSLPEAYQREVLHYTQFLQQKAQADPSTPKRAPRKAGLRRGFIRHMSLDFDAPLDDMADYM